MIAMIPPELIGLGAFLFAAIVIAVGISALVKRYGSVRQDLGQADQKVKEVQADEATRERFDQAMVDRIGRLGERLRRLRGDDSKR